MMGHLFQLIYFIFKKPLKQNKKKPIEKIFEINKDKVFIKLIKKIFFYD
jgi:hypothetical protein